MSKSGKRRKYARGKDSRTYKPRFVIVAEGRVTERQYFNCFNRFRDLSERVVVDCKREKDSTSSPGGVLKTMQRHLKDDGFGASDHAWLVVDKDKWKDTQINELYQWSTDQKNFGLALSNPKFEYWLLLHFEEVKGTLSSSQCCRRLARHIPDYNKRVPCHKISLSCIQQAVDRAKKRDISPSSKWPQDTGSTVYRLVSLILPMASGPCPR